MFTTGISEIVLIVNDVQAAARFYREVDGLAPHTEANDEWAWFWTGEPDHSGRLAVHRGTLLYEENSPHPPGARWGHVHYALNVPRDRLQAALDRAREHGIKVYGPQRFEWMKATGHYLYDPDGNLVEYWSPD